ncbi:MAG TPA: HEAT repeat domain-containing protein [Vicinamibacterales bacterium]|nr:HEAT repeat domain-containing protein [Vicinamibacterales bacterium]
MTAPFVLAGLLTFIGAAAEFQGAPAQRDVTAEQVRTAIGQLGTLEFTVRMEAARTVRRAAPAVAVPALTDAVSAHPDGYVRFRALVLLSGFNDPRTRDVMTRMLEEKNDRLRAVAYAYFEHNPDPAALPRLIDALSREESEFVRPALTRAIAAYGNEPRARDTMVALVPRGQDFFRGAVIEAIGDYRGAYAFDALTAVARLEGPLQDDAVLALGKIGDKRALTTFAALQQTAPRATQPAIAAAICLIGVNCGSHQRYLTETISFAIANAGFQDLLRGAAAGLAALAVSGNESAMRTLIELGAPSRDPARAAIALALGTVALRNTPLALKVLEDESLHEGGIELLREAFDMLEEDFIEERFFVAVRRAYWQAAEGSPTRKAAEALIRKLEF